MDTTSCYDQHVTSNGDDYFCRTHGAPSDYLEQATRPTFQARKYVIMCWCALLACRGRISSRIIEYVDFMWACICLSARWRSEVGYISGCKTIHFKSISLHPPMSPNQLYPTGHARAVAQAWPPGRSQPTGRMIINGCIPCLLLGRQFKSRTGKTLTNSAGFTTRGRWFCLCAGGFSRPAISF